MAPMLEYTPADMDAGIYAPPRWYGDFPNRQRLLGLSHDAYCLLTGGPTALTF